MTLTRKQNLADYDHFQQKFVLRALLYLLLCCWVWRGVEASFSVNKVGPIKLLPGPYGFSWEACIDTATGIATSKEVVQATPRSSIVQHFQWGSQSGIREQEVWNAVIKRLERYPQWLVRGPVTFGLFHAVPVRDGGGYSLQDRFFGINFLTFGPPQSKRFSSLKTQPSSAIGQELVQRRVGHCTITIPIIGGLLALRKTNRHDMGCLKFTLNHNEVLKKTQLITEIQGYSPWLVGGREPVPFHRKCLYLSTQSIVHAFVMWKWQRHCLGTSYKQM